MKNIIKAKSYFLWATQNLKPGFKYFPEHIRQVEYWAEKLLNQYPKANKKTVLLSVYLHDIGHMVGEKESDHAINSELEARRFLQEIGEPTEIIEQVAHCVRSHRCKDILPSTIEAKILAAADSASHLTDFCYITLIELNGKDFCLGKLDRDYRDISLFPAIKEELTPLYNGWKNLINAFPD